MLHLDLVTLQFSPCRQGARGSPNPADCARLYYNFSTGNVSFQLRAAAEISFSFAGRS